jgi:hypothetical protein
MPQDICSPIVQGLNSRLARCSDGTRMRGEPPHASAVQYQRFLLLEVPGPWGRAGLEDSRLQAGIAQRLAQAADASDIRVVLIRRPGRHPPVATGDRTRALAWAFVDITAGIERVHWGSWRDPADLLDIDLSATVPFRAASFQAGSSGPGRLALVCTNGKRDQCCAISGRPVAAAISAASGWDTWECSHIGGHRFAATLLLLPYGDMFGQLDPESAQEVLRQFDAGQIMLSHYRGRCGQPFPVQAALHAAAMRLGDCRRGAIRASSVRSVGDRWEVEVSHRPGVHGPERAYRLTIGTARLDPAPLSCADAEPKPVTAYQAISFTPAPQGRLALISGR